MRGLPAPPPDVVRVVVEFDVDGSFESSGFWIRVPRLDELSVADLQELVDELVPQLLDFSSGLTHSGVSVSVLRLTSFSSQRNTLIAVPSTNAGHWTGGQAHNVALCFHWLTPLIGSGGHTVTHWPGFPDIFTANGESLTTGAFVLASEAAFELLTQWNDITTPFGDFVRVGTVHRSRDGVPLDASFFEPFAGVIATPRVGTLRRRIPARRPISPS